jgi:hypothetical protein
MSDFNENFACPDLQDAPTITKKDITKKSAEQKIPTFLVINKRRVEAAGVNGMS